MKMAQDINEIINNQNLKDPVLTQEGKNTRALKMFLFPCRGDGIISNHIGIHAGGRRLIQVFSIPAAGRTEMYRVKDNISPPVKDQ